MSRSLPLLGLGLGLLACGIGYGFLGLSYDDNFITYRFARNWLNGLGLVYNEGERVFGTTAPGYALLLACLTKLLAPIGAQVPQVGTVISLTSLLGLVFVLGRVLRHSANGALRTGAFGLLVLTSPVHIYLLGSEAFPVLALIVTAAHLLHHESRPILAGALMGAAIALRLDAGLAAIVVGGVAWAHARRVPVAYVVTGVLITLAWLGFLFVRFGTVIPNTLAGKHALAEVPYTLRQWQLLGLAFPHGSRLVLIAGATVGLVGAWRSRFWKDPMALALVIWGIALECTYRIIGVWFSPWYHLALWQALPLLFVLAVVSPGSPVRRALGCVALLCLMIPSSAHVASQWRRWHDSRAVAYREVGQYIRDHSDPQARVLAAEIGVLGYFCERSILDLGGLVSPDFTAAKLQGRRAELVASEAPDFIVTGAMGSILDEALASPELKGRYREVLRFPVPGSRPVRLLAIDDPSLTEPADWTETR